MTTPTDTTVPAVPTQDEINSLNEALTTAESHLATTEKSLVDAMKKGDVTVLLSVVNDRNKAVAARDKAKRAYDDAVYMSKNSARMEAAVEAKAAIVLAIEAPEVINAFDLGVSGISITRDAEGHFTVTVAGVSRAPSAKAPRAASKSTGSTGTRVRSKVRNIATGELFSTREWLEMHGNDEERAQAIAAKTKVTSASGGSYYPNFQPQLRAAISRMSGQWELVAATEG